MPDCLYTGGVAERDRRAGWWWLLPSALGVALLGGALAIVVLAGRGRDTSAPRPRAFVPPAAAHPAVAADVQQIRGSTITLGSSSGNTDATLPPALRVYVLERADARAAAPGDWVTVIGISNEVLNFTIRLVLIIPASAGAALDAEGIPRLPSGLAGHEANRDAAERPLAAGRVERVDGQTITLALHGRSATIDAASGSPIRRVTAADTSAIREGDRVAYVPTRPGAGAGEAQALLVLPAR